MRAALLAWFEGAGLIAFALIVVLLGIGRLVHAFIAFVLLFGWAAYPAIQYEGRHVFHLELLALLLVAAVVAWSWRLITTFDPEAIGGLRVRGVRATAFAGALFATLLAALIVARRVQAPRVRALFESYVAAPTEPLTVTPAPLDGGLVRLAVNPFRGTTLDYGADEAMIVVDVDAGRCSSERVDLRLHYDDTVPEMALDFSRTVDVPLGAAGTSTRVLFPAYALYRKGRVVSHLAGIDVPSAAVDCVHVGRIRDLSALGAAPLLNVTLSPQWRDGPLYQQMSPGGVLPMPLWRPILHWWRG
jgi:hypothetical protein